jgi:hypothetical protein
MQLPTATAYQSGSVGRQLAINPARPGRACCRAIVATAREHPHPIAVAAAYEPEAVVLDLMYPLRPARDGMGEGRKARLDKAGRTTDGRGGAPEHRDCPNVSSLLRRIGTRGHRARSNQMATYYFHVVEGQKFFDPHGLDLPDEDAALHYGEDLARHVAAPVEVTDIRGKVLARYSPKR